MGCAFSIPAATNPDTVAVTSLFNPEGDTSSADTGRRPALDVNAASSGRSGQTVQNYHGLRGVPRSLCKRIVLGWAGMPAAAPPLPPERAIIATSAAPPRPLSPETLLALSATVVHAESRLVAAGVSPIMLAALCIIESGGCPAAVQYRDAVGDVGRGLWQMLLSTARWLAASEGWARYGEPCAVDLEHPLRCAYYAAGHLASLTPPPRQQQQRQQQRRRRRAPGGRAASAELQHQQQQYQQHQQQHATPCAAAAVCLEQQPPPPLAALLPLVGGARTTNRCSDNKPPSTTVTAAFGCEEFRVRAFRAGPKGVDSAAANEYWCKYSRARGALQQVAACMATTVAAAAVAAPTRPPQGPTAMVPAATAQLLAALVSEWDDGRPEAQQQLPPTQPHAEAAGGRQEQQKQQQQKQQQHCDSEDESTILWHHHPTELIDPWRQQQQQQQHLCPVPARHCWPQSCSTGRLSRISVPHSWLDTALARMHSIDADAMAAALRAAAGAAAASAGSSRRAGRWDDDDDDAMLRPPSVTMHVVRAGETLESLAAACRVTPADIVAANPEICGTSSSSSGSSNGGGGGSGVVRSATATLSHHDCICLPVPAVPPQLYVTRPGDSLCSIARAACVPLSRLLSANPGLSLPLMAGQLQDGWVILLPGLRSSPRDSAAVPGMAGLRSGPRDSAAVPGMAGLRSGPRDGGRQQQSNYLAASSSTTASVAATASSRRALRMMGNTTATSGGGGGGVAKADCDVVPPGGGHRDQALACLLRWPVGTPCGGGMHAAGESDVCGAPPLGAGAFCFSTRVPLLPASSS